MSISYGEGTRIMSREPENSQTRGGGYIPTYIKHCLKWFERDGLLTYFDQLKYQEYEKNKEK